MCSNKKNQAGVLAQADKRGCCSSAAKDTSINSPVVQSDLIESRGCCKSADAQVCSDGTDTDAEVKIGATMCCVATATKPASGIDCAGERADCCSGVIECTKDTPGKKDGCCSSVKEPELSLNAEVKAQPKLDGCGAAKSKPKSNEVFVPYDNLDPPLSQDKIDECCSSEDQGIHKNQEIVPPCCEGIASNCCDGKHFHSNFRGES